MRIHTSGVGSGVIGVEAGASVSTIVSTGTRVGLSVGKALRRGNVGFFVGKAGGNDVE